MNYLRIEQSLTRLNAARRVLNLAGYLTTRENRAIRQRLRKEAARLRLPSNVIETLLGHAPEGKS